VFGDERRPAHPVPALMINGQLDASVPVAGGPPGGRFTEAWDGTPTLPSLAQGRFWAAANGCTGEPEASVQGAVQRTRWRCPAGREVEALLVADNGHAWPGGQSGSRRADPPSKALNANEAIWAFFKAHAR
jgi:polyhydroxybutyrate depolymerase